MRGYIEPTLNFNDGLEVLCAYHESFVLQGKRLLALSEAMCKHGVDEEWAAQSIELVDYYTGATRIHHRDEERCLFPLILNRSFLIDGMIERLALDHEEIDARWAELANYLRAPERDLAQCLALARQFEQHLQAHIERENLDFFPEVKRLLSLEQRVEMGGQMERWRTLSIPGD